MKTLGITGVFLVSGVLLLSGLNHAPGADSVLEKGEEIGLHEREARARQG